MARNKTNQRIKDFFNDFEDDFAIKENEEDDVRIEMEVKKKKIKLKGGNKK